VLSHDPLPRLLEHRLVEPGEGPAVFPKGIVRGILVGAQMPGRRKEPLHRLENRVVCVVF